MTTHYWGDNATSPCGRAVASAYGTSGHGYSSEWANVDCPACLAERPADVRTSLHPFYITFGVQYSREPNNLYGTEAHPYWPGADGKGWVRIMARTAEQARHVAHAYFGDRYAFLYPEDRFDTTADREYYPLGELAVIELGQLGIEGDGPHPIVSTSDPRLYGVGENTTVATRIEGIRKEDPGVDPDVALVHRTCLQRGLDLFERIDEHDSNVMAFELDWSVPNECPVCHTSLT